MIDQNLVEELAPHALAWAQGQEGLILSCGFPLGPAAAEDAVRAGVQNPERIRILVVDRIPLPDDARLAEASRRAHIITEASRGMAVGYGIVIRLDSWGDRELLLHQLVHVAQCERGGGLANFVAQYLTDRQSSKDFSVGALEHEARSRARDLAQN